MRDKERQKEIGLLRSAGTVCFQCKFVLEGEGNQLFLYLLGIREKAVNLHINRDLHVDVGKIGLFSAGRF